MSQIRFHHVFIALLSLSLLSAFILPARITNPARANVQNIFAPVAVPIRKIASWAHVRTSPEKPIDDAHLDGKSRPLKDVLDENTQLRQSVSALSRQLDELQRINAERDTVGEDIRKLCMPVSVMGGDSGSKQSLSLLATTLDGLRDGMPVLYMGNIAGLIERAGVGGAQVRLVTDTDFRVQCAFARFTRNKDGVVEFGRLAFPPTVLKGNGKGRMVINNLAKRDVEAAGLAENDWVVVDDPDWPLCLRGRRLGKIIAKPVSHDGPLFVDLLIEPPQHLLALREVMVLVQEK